MSQQPTAEPLHRSTILTGRCPYPGCTRWVETDIRPLACGDHREAITAKTQARLERLRSRRSVPPTRTRP